MFGHLLIGIARLHSRAWIETINNLTLPQAEPESPGFIAGRGLKHFIGLRIELKAKGIARLHSRAWIETPTGEPQTLPTESESPGFIAGRGLKPPGPSTPLATSLESPGFIAGRGLKQRLAR